MAGRRAETIGVAHTLIQHFDIVSGASEGHPIVIPAAVQLGPQSLTSHTSAVPWAAGVAHLRLWAHPVQAVKSSEVAVEGADAGAVLHGKCG